MFRNSKFHAKTCTGRVSDMLDHVTFDLCALSASNVPGPFFDRESLACGTSSCRDRCGPIGPDDPWTCYCDTLCRILRDCCPDVELHCFLDASYWLQLETTAMDDLKHFMECQVLDGYYSKFQDFSRGQLLQIFDITVVTSCPDATEKELVDTCRSQFDGALNALPACHPKNEVVFANVYCAMCHGYLIEELITFEADISCSSQDFDDDITYVDDFWKKCSPIIHLFLPPKCLPSMKRQQCLSVMEGDARCLAYKNPVTIDGAGPIYRNQYCIPSAHIHKRLQCQAMGFGLTNSPANPVISSQFSMLLNTSGALHVLPTRKRSLMGDLGDVLLAPGKEQMTSSGKLYDVHDMISLTVCSAYRIVADLLFTSV